MNNNAVPQYSNLPEGNFFLTDVMTLDGYKDQIHTELDQAGVLVPGEFRSDLNIAIEGALGQIHTQISDSVRQSFAAERLAMINTDDYTPQDYENELAQEINRETSERIGLIADLIVHICKDTANPIIDNTGAQRFSINSSNIQEIQAVCGMLGYFIHQPDAYTLLFDVAHVRNGVESMEQSLPEILRLVLENPNPARIMAIVNDGIINQATFTLDLPTQELALANTLWTAMSESQIFELIDYAIAQGHADTVIRNAAVYGGVPPVRLIQQLGNRMPSETLSFLNSGVFSAQREAIDQAFRMTEVYSEIASRDITSSATDPSKWAALGVYGLSAIATALGGIVCVASGSPGSLLAFGPHILAMKVAFEHAQNKGITEWVADAANYLVINREARESLSQDEWRNIASFTAMSNLESLKLYSSDEMIASLKSAMNINSDGNRFSLETYRDSLRESNPELSEQFETTIVPQFEGNLRDLELKLEGYIFSLHALDIDTQSDWFVKIGRHHNLSTDILTSAA
jgi:hypothetical protein